MTAVELEFSRRIPVRELPEGGKKYRFEATTEERTAVARRLGVIGIESLEAKFTVVPEGRGAMARGNFEAVVVQECVVTLEPVTSRIDGRIVQRFAPGGAVPSPDAEIDFDALEEDPPEPLSDGAAELGELIVEHMALALDPYPRRSDAHVKLPHENGERPGSPFAGLRDVKISAKEG